MTKLVRKIGLVAHDAMKKRPHRVGSLELRIAHGAQVLLYRYYGNSYS